MRPDEPVRCVMSRRCVNLLQQATPLRAFLIAALLIAACMGVAVPAPVRADEESCDDDPGPGDDCDLEPICETCVTLDGLKLLAMDTLTEFEQIRIPFDQAGVASFGSGSVAAEIPLTQDLGSTRTVIQGLSPHEGHQVHQIAFAPALDTAIRTAENAPRGDRAVAVLYNLDMGGPVDVADVRAKAEEARNKGIRIYVIALGTGYNPTIGPGQLADLETLEDVAQMTSGKLYQDANGDDLAEIMRDIAEHLPTRLTR